MRPTGPGPQSRCTRWQIRAAFGDQRSDRVGPPCSRALCTSAGCWGHRSAPAITPACPEAARPQCGPRCCREDARPEPQGTGTSALPAPAARGRRAGSGPLPVRSAGSTGASLGPCLPGPQRDVDTRGHPVQRAAQRPLSHRAGRAQPASVSPLRRRAQLGPWVGRRAAFPPHVGTQHRALRQARATKAGAERDPCRSPGRGTKPPGAIGWASPPAGPFPRPRLAPPTRDTPGAATCPRRTLRLCLEEACWAGAPFLCGRRQTRVTTLKGASGGDEEGEHVPTPARRCCLRGPRPHDPTAAACEPLGPPGPLRPRV